MLAKWSPMPSTHATTAAPADRKGEAMTPSALCSRLVPEPSAEMMHSTTAMTAAPPSSQMPVFVKNRFIRRFLSTQQGDAEVRQHTAQQQYRQAHHIEKVAVDALHQQRALSLHTVGARLVHRLAAGDVGAQLRL